MKLLKIDWHNQNIIIILLKYGYNKLNNGTPINKRIFKMEYLIKTGVYDLNKLKETFDELGIDNQYIHKLSDCSSLNGNEKILNNNIDEKFKEKEIEDKRILIDTLFYKLYETSGGKPCNEVHPGFIAPNRYFQLLEHEALEQAKESSTKASWYSRFAMIFAGLGFLMNISPDSYLLNKFISIMSC